MGGTQPELVSTSIADSLVVWQVAMFGTLWFTETSKQQLGRDASSQWSLRGEGPLSPSAARTPEITALRQRLHSHGRGLSHCTSGRRVKATI